MKKVYIVCRNNEFEKTLCLEYVKVHKLEVFQASYPKNEEEREAIVKEVVSLVKKGQIDTFLYSLPAALSSYSDLVIDRIVKLVKSGVMVRMAYFYMFDIFGKERYENELRPLIQQLPMANVTNVEEEKPQRATKTAYVVHDGSYLCSDLCNRSVKMHSLTVYRTSCPKSEKQNIAVIKEIYKEVIKGSIDTVMFSEPQVISLDSRVAGEIIKLFQAGGIDTVICMFEMLRLYDEDAWENDIPKLISADEKYRRSLKGMLMKLLKR